MDKLLRLRLVIHGTVQGVGFRPFVYRLATQLGLYGWVNNSAQGVFIEVEGSEERVRQFLRRIPTEKPPRSFIQSMEPSFLDAAGYTEFVIQESSGQGGKSVWILPDIAACPDCLREMFDPRDRRYRYPFINCTNCGPRFTIIEALPYDRANTTMRSFAMCDLCQAEYEDPLNRRFHAQPNACPRCGPQIALWDGSGHLVARHEDATIQAVAALRQGKIVAVKGMGGFHLLVVAGDGQAVARLRQRKHREQKPFAVMYPSLAQVMQDCLVEPQEERLLLSPEAPIVLLRRCVSTGRIADTVAPANPYLGVMLPYTPLHHLLLADICCPLVATSGNLSDEPICIDERYALQRLAGIADLFLVHDRPIARHADDSIVRIVGGREMMLRRARGYAPLPIHVGQELPPVLAVGAHLKNNVAFAMNREIFVSQHIGDLESMEAFSAFTRVIDSFRHLYNWEPQAVACDLHPDYRATQFAQKSGLPIYRVQHHHAHILACMAENEIAPPLLGVAWDGTGLGEDLAVWGGEFLRLDADGFSRVAHLRPFPLVGGDAAVQEPRRVALALLHTMWGERLWHECDRGDRRETQPLTRLLQTFTARELAVMRQMLQRNSHLAPTTSAGRLFDGVAALLGLHAHRQFEGQAAMSLEFVIGDTRTDVSYAFRLTPETESKQMCIIDWAPMLESIVADMTQGVQVATIAAKFHNTLADIITSVAIRMGLAKVVMSGGCFQNKYLAEQAIARLRAGGHQPYWHQRVPPNDGCIALGQIIAAVRNLTLSH